jgi:hypothetical protein
MFATPPATHGNSGTFVVRWLAGASCTLQRTGGGQSAADNFGPVTIQTNGSGQTTRGRTWPASTGDGYLITAVCTLTGQPTTTSPAMTVVWP